MEEGEVKGPDAEHEEEARPARPRKSNTRYFGPE